jgi:hypothetical protein
MKTYIAHVTFADGESPSTTETVLTSDIGEVAYSLDESGIWHLTCEGAFAGVTACSINANGGEVDATPPLPQQMSIARASDNVVAVKFGNGSEVQFPNASPYRIEINIAE